ncbi:MAG: alanine racemase [Helcococcus sp.]|nr:alanine racemase [Helcococcus sp.]
MKLDANRMIVNLDAIKDNINILKNITKNKFFAVVKANAYGLGAVSISKYIENDVDMFCVATINEGIELRENGIKKDILILGYVLPDNYHFLSEYNLIMNIYNFEIAQDVNKIGCKIRGHIKVETGHNRLGFQVNEKSVSEIRLINDMENIHIEGIFTHYSSADEKDREYTIYQLHKFNEMISKLGDISKKWIKHSANDAAGVAYNTGSDAIRSGISMYGMYPSEYMKEKLDLGIKNSFELKSKVSNIKTIKKGEAVSYGRTFISDKERKIATVSIGYADGYMRIISNIGYVLINGKKASILGNITMDQFMVDISDIEVKLHDDVVLIGKSGNEEITPDMVANWAKTISYEVMTSISPRVSRIYIEEKNCED